MIIIIIIIEDKEGSLLTEETAVNRRWTEYCEELYNFELRPDTSILDNAYNTNREPGDAPILQEEVEEAVRSLKGGVDNIPAELLKHGGELIKTLTTICQRIWETKQCTKRMDPIPDNTPSQERQPKTLPELQNHQPNQPS